MSDTDDPGARRALPPRDTETDSAPARRLAEGAPPELDDDHEPAADRPDRDASDPAPDPAPDPALDPAPDPVAPGAASGPVSSRTPPRRVGLVAGLMVVAALVLAGILQLTTGGGLPGPFSTPTPTLDRATLLVEPSELNELGGGTTWKVSSTLTTIEPGSPQPRCLALASETEPATKQSWVRTLAAEGPEASAALHQVDHYATVEDATRAWEQRVDQLGACTRSTVWLTQAVTLEGVADQAMGATLVFQDATSEYHTLVVSRTGDNVNLLDLTSAGEPWSFDAATAALTALGSRQCAATSGTCPTSPVVAERVPPATEPVGWLAPVDLPRLTPGAGAWRGTDVNPMNLAGAACEAVELLDVPGATAAQRTYLLSDDARAQGIGVDQAVYTFATTQEATDLVARLTENIDGCAGRTATATVNRTGEVAQEGASGPSWFITQKVNGDQTARFRVGTVAVGARVVYVFANPSAEVDFTDEQWQAVVSRAAARATQLP